MITSDRAAADGVPHATVRSDLPATAGRNTALDGLRVIAAMAVLVTHVGGETGFEFTGSPASWVVSRGDVGVPIFFALSGLLLYRPWARAALRGQPGPATLSYMWRRALRILPAYWLVVIVALVALNHQHVRSLSTWVQYLLLVQNYNLHPWWAGTGADGLAQMWSLVVEVSFYLVLPLLAAMLTWWSRWGAADLNRRARRLLAGIAVLGLSSYGFTVLAFYPRLELWLGATLPRLLTWFAAGMAVAVISEWAHAEHADETGPNARQGDGKVARFCRTIAGSAEACWLLAVVAFAIACTQLAGPETLAVPSLWEFEVKTALYTVIAAALVAPVAFQPGRPTWVSRALGNPVMSFLGRISYGIFLWQFVIIYAFFRLAHANDAFHGGAYTWPAVVAILIIVVALTVGAAVVSYYLIELPAQSLYRSRRGRSGKHALPARPGAASRKVGVLTARAAGPPPGVSQARSSAIAPRHVRPASTRQFGDEAAQDQQAH